MKKHQLLSTQINTRVFSGAVAGVCWNEGAQALTNHPGCLCMHIPDHAI